MKEKESLEILQDVIGPNDEVLGINWDNHKKYSKIKNCFRITSDLMSIKLLVDLMDEPEIKEVFYHPSVSPPGAGVDPISLRYKIYIVYN